MKKLFLLLIATAFAAGLFADCTVYYAGTYSSPYAYAWNSSGKNANWPGQKMTSTGYTFNSKTIWTITFSTNYPNIIFNSGSGSQTADLLTECGSLYDEENGRWVEYSGTGNVIDTSIVKDPEGVAGVPAEYGGVMLQGFYWDSYTKTSYSNTKWTTLTNKYVDLIAQDFDLIWLPPSGNGGGVGYYTKTYSKQSSDWGTAGALHTLIAALHAKDVKVIADIVINHRQASSGWCNFSKEDFGKYGAFQLTSEHICSGDECFTTSTSGCYASDTHGAADTGEDDGGCRDLDHTNTYVQDYIKAYLAWMKDSMKYDGWRYDMVKGYHGRYVSMYNNSSLPFFSVGEYWDGSANSLGNYLSAASFNTMVFDFCFKYKLNSAITKTTMNGTNLKNCGLRSLGRQKYAVTFIDNHDTFERSDNQGSEFLGYNVVLTDYKKRIMQANAFMLMMPGVPCVSWPHWYTFREDISALIALRKAAGIHSESVVTDEAGGVQNYVATITGKNGSVILRMGTKRDTTVPAGYFLAIQGLEFEVYASTGVDYSPAVITALEETAAVEAQPVVRKEMRDGHLYIICDGVTYDAMGRVVK